MYSGGVVRPAARPIRARSPASLHLSEEADKDPNNGGQLSMNIIDEGISESRGSLARSSNLTQSTTLGSLSDNEEDEEKVESSLDVVFQGSNGITPVDENDHEGKHFHLNGHVPGKPPSGKRRQLKAAAKKIHPVITFTNSEGHDNNSNELILIQGTDNMGVQYRENVPKTPPMTSRQLKLAPMLNPVQNETEHGETDSNKLHSSSNKQHTVVEADPVKSNTLYSGSVSNGQNHTSRLEIPDFRLNDRQNKDDRDVNYCDFNR